MKLIDLKKYKILNYDFNLKSALVSVDLVIIGEWYEFPSIDYLKKYTNYKSIIQESRNIKK